MGKLVNLFGTLADPQTRAEKTQVRQVAPRILHETAKQTVAPPLRTVPTNK